MKTRQCILRLKEHLIALSLIYYTPRCVEFLNGSLKNVEKYKKKYTIFLAPMS